MITRQQAIVNEAARLVIEEQFSPAAAIISAAASHGTCEANRKQARLLWRILIHKIQLDNAVTAAE